MKIYCDIDSTINDHWYRIRRNTVGGWPGTAIDKKAFAREEVMQDEPLDDARKILYLFKNSFGAEISFLTARNWPFAREITMSWLKDYAFEYKNLYIVNSMEAKLNFLEHNRPDVVIDDFCGGQETSILTFHRDIANNIQQLGIKVIVFRNDWYDVLDQVRYYYGN